MAATSGSIKSARRTPRKYFQKLIAEPPHTNFRGGKPLTLNWTAMPANTFLRNTLISLCLLFCANAQANPFGDAWSCATGTVKASYKLADKGFHAAEVLGGAPECVALASAGDVPLLTITGAMVALNAASPETLPSGDCENALKTYAALPIAKSLDVLFPSVIPSSYLDAANAEAQEKLWDFLSHTEPIAEVTQRASCGCKFLEAGISVQDFMEMFATVKSAGEKCEKVADEVPGYTEFKNLVAGPPKGLTVDIDYLVENIFTDGEKINHAMAKAIDPNHDFATQHGVTPVFGTPYIQPDSTSSLSGNEMRVSCMNHFNNDQTSPLSAAVQAVQAEEVCSAMVAQFGSEYQALVPVFRARDQLVKQLPEALAPIHQSAIDQCAQFYQWASNADIFKELKYTPPEFGEKECKNEANYLLGWLEYKNPYDSGAVGSLGDPLPKETIDGYLKGTSQYFFMEPISMKGAEGGAYQALQSNGFDVPQAIAVAKTAYQISVDNMIARRKFDMFKVALKEAKIKNAAALKEFNDNVGNYWSGKCPSGDFYKPCVDALRHAWDVCKDQTDKVPYLTGGGEFPPQDPEAMKKVQAQCKSSYLALTLAYDKFVAMRKLAAAQQVYCPPPAKGGNVLHAIAYEQCKKEAQLLMDKCTGGQPKIGQSFYYTGKVSQAPAGIQDCSAAVNLFDEKWGTDEKIIGKLNGAYSAAAITCQIDGFSVPGCTEAVSAKVDEYKAAISKQANEMMGPIDSLSQLEPFKEIDFTQLISPGQKGIIVFSPLFTKIISLKTKGDEYVEAVLKVPENFYKGKEAEKLALQIYGKQCPPRSSKVDYPGKCRREIIRTIENCAHYGMPGRTGADKTASSNKPKHVPGSKETDEITITLSPGEQQVRDCKPQLQAVIDEYKQQYAQEEQKNAMPGRRTSAQTAKEYDQLTK